MKTDNPGFDVAAFRFMIRRLIEIGSPVTINNDSADHARVILEEMFRASRKTAYVFCGCISMSVWGSDVMAANIEDAIGRGVDVRFVVQHPGQMPDESPTVQVLRRYGDRVSFSEKFSDFGSHFAVFDEKMYRFEKDDEAKTAIACANGRDNASPLHQLAVQMLAVSQKAS